MDRASYDYMKVDVVYDGRLDYVNQRCTITKAAEDIHKGYLHAVMQDGKTRRSHFSLFTLIEHDKDYKEKLLNTLP